MKFPNIDFDAINNILNNMSDEEKEDMMNMAQNMMNNMNSDNMPQMDPEEESEEDFYTFLHIDPQEYSVLPDFIMDPLEAAVDLETFYDEDRQADYSGSILFYAKTVLFLLRKVHAPIYQEVLQRNEFSNPDATTLAMYYQPLFDDNNIHNLVNQGAGNVESWIAHRNLLQSLVTLLSKAEYATVSYEELQSIKTQLFTDKGLLNIVNDL